MLRRKWGRKDLKGDGDRMQRPSTGGRKEVGEGGGDRMPSRQVTQRCSIQKENLGWVKVNAALSERRVYIWQPHPTPFTPQATGSRFWSEQDG